MVTVQIKRTVRSMTQTVQVIGPWLLDPAISAVYAGIKGKQAPGGARTPIGDALSSGTDTLMELTKAAKAGDDTLKSGPSKGESKRTVALWRALDHGMDLLALATGLPIMGPKQSGKSLYRAIAGPPAKPGSSPFIVNPETGAMRPKTLKEMMR